MSNHSTKQHTLWLLAAIAAPAAHFSGSGWMMAALCAAAVLPLSLLPKNWESVSRPYALLQVLWLGAVAGMLLPGSAAYWPSNNDLAVPLTLLTLAALTGAAAAPAVGAVTALCMALLAVPAAVSGVTHMELGWLRPEPAPWPLGLTLILLLPNLPVSAGKGKTILGAAAVTVALSALVQGVMTTAVASSLPDPFYQTARSLGHLEPVVAAGLSLGWYALACVLIQSAARIAKNGGMGEKLACVLAWGTATGFVVFRQQPNALLVTVFSLFLWVVTPFLRVLKKLEKSA